MVERYPNDRAVHVFPDVREGLLHEHREVLLLLHRHVNQVDLGYLLRLLLHHRVHIKRYQP